MTPTPFQKLVVAMLKCEQTPGQSVYQHGVSVNHHFEDLISVLSQGGDSDWRLPEWAVTYADDIIKNIHPSEITSVYLVYHDAGKSECKVIDENGKVHFPNHAAVSKRVFLEAGGDPVVANLIGWDMVLHTAKAEEIEEYCKIWTKQDAATLLLAALAEIHSNAKMFGGIESASFKIKWKQLERRGKQVCKHFFKENESGSKRTFEKCC